MKNPLKIYIISDSIGRTARTLVDACISQFPDSKLEVHTYNFVKSLSILEDILEEIKNTADIIVHTNVKKEQACFIQQYCQQHGILHFDLMTELLATIAQLTEDPPMEKIGARLSMDDDYFERISAIEFAVNTDDGANKEALLKADMVLIGPSRTSKTPLSIYLANLNYRVANLPLYPEIQLAEEIYQLNPFRLFGLTNDMDIMKTVRRDRMIAYGMNPDSHYASEERIQEELDYCHQLYKDLNCTVINVAQKSIEETASDIIACYKSHFNPHEAKQQDER